MSADVSGSGGQQPDDQGKGERQALYLAYRAMPVDESGGRMTQGAAAKLAGVDTATVSRWKKASPQFAAKEGAAARDGVGQAKKLAKAGAWALLGTAIFQLAALLRDAETPAGVRASVALKILEWNGAPDPVEIEVSGDPWGALLQQLRETGEANG